MRISRAGRKEALAPAGLDEELPSIFQLPRELLLAHRRHLTRQQRARRAAQSAAEQQVAGEAPCNSAAQHRTDQDRWIHHLERRDKPCHTLDPLDTKDGLVFQDTSQDEPVLQVFAANARRPKLASLEAEGKLLFDNLWQKSAKHGTGQRSSIPAFGVWHSIGCGSLGFTAMTKAYRSLAIRLLDWGRRYTHAALQKRSRIHASFCQKLRARRKIRPYLTRLFGRDAKLLHSFWTTLYLFGNSTGQPHKDNEDDSPSLLFNFGGEAWLALPDFGVKIKLRPLDTVVFASSKYTHYTLPVASANSSGGDAVSGSGRWAIGCFMRTSVLQKRPVNTFSQARTAQAITEVSTTDQQGTRRTSKRENRTSTR